MDLQVSIFFSFFFKIKIKIKNSFLDKQISPFYFILFFTQRNCSALILSVAFSQLPIKSIIRLKLFSTV